jgi:osmotically inducible lipoprotein OsmB
MSTIAGTFVEGCFVAGRPRTLHSTEHQPRNAMKTRQRFAVGALAVTVLLSLGGCAGMSEREKDTAIGAGVGGVAGAVLTGGSAVGTVGGAVVGGVIGNQVGK